MYVASTLRLSDFPLITTRTPQNLAHLCRINEIRQGILRPDMGLPTTSHADLAASSEVSPRLGASAICLADILLGVTVVRAGFALLGIVFLETR
jgi:hypothetical protein